MELTDKIISENNLTTIMVTHNMNQAIRYGNSMIMLHEGKIIFRVEGDTKRALTVEEVVRKFGADLKDETLLS
jgi:putative ABC transport system ATP-binding protein